MLEKALFNVATVAKVGLMDFEGILTVSGSALRLRVLSNRWRVHSERLSMPSDAFDMHQMAF